MSGNFTVSSFLALNSAIEVVDSEAAGSGAYTISLTGDITNSADLKAINMTAGVSLVIDGNGYTISGDNQYEGLFVYQGQVTVENLTIANALAVGGAGVSGGGGGAGLGGGLFIAGHNSTEGTGGNVTLNAVTFLNDQATGGAALSGVYTVGGGGGLNGGTGGRSDPAGDSPLGGGGGIGLGASGQGDLSYFVSAKPGIIFGEPAAPGNYGAGASGGGGGDGGGGGVNGTYHSFVTTGTGASGGYFIPGNGGFGGGGAGFSMGAGAGGFGGGGGGGASSTGAYGGAGGFGGGGGDGAAGGFGGGANAGGGLGAGGDIFVQQGGSLTIESGTLGLGTVTGGTGANAGAAFGTALFLQGDQSQTLTPAAGQTLTIAGSIDDESGSTTTSGQGGTSTGAGGLILNGDGTVILSAASDYTGGTTLDSGTLILDAPGATGAGGITFGTGTSPSLTFATADAPTTAIAGFVFGDQLDISDLAITSASTLYLNSAGILAIPDANASFGTLDLTFTGIGTTQPFIFSPDGSGSAAEVPCFAAGTRILSTDGDILVEDIRPGDELVTVREGGPVTSKVVWTGRRAIAIPRHPSPKTVRPVRIIAGAFGDNLPERDLRLSPEHAIYVNGALFTAESLINGITIFQEPTTTHVTYHHIELESHDIILAEGLPCESFLDTGNKAMFEKISGIIALHPDFHPGAGAEFCAPLIRGGEALDRIRLTLTSRATQTRTAA